MSVRDDHDARQSIEIRALKRVTGANMAEVAMCTKRAFTSEEQREIEKLFGFEVVLDFDEFPNDRQGTPNYFFGHDSDDEEDMFTHEEAQAACEKIQAMEIMEVITGLAVQPYQWGSKW